MNSVGILIWLVWATCAVFCASLLDDVNGWVWKKFGTIRTSAHLASVHRYSWFHLEKNIHHGIHEYNLLKFRVPQAGWHWSQPHLEEKWCVGWVYIIWSGRRKFECGMYWEPVTV